MLVLQLLALIFSNILNLLWMPPRASSSTPAPWRSSQRLPAATSGRRQRVEAASSAQWGQSLRHTGVSWWIFKMSSTLQETYRRRHTRSSITSSRKGGRCPPASAAWILRSTRRHALPLRSWRNRASFVAPTAAGRLLFTWCARQMAAGGPAATSGSSTSSRSQTSTPFPGWTTSRVA